MTMLELAFAWYCFIGLVWAYLVAHEYVTGGARFRELWGAGRRTRAIAVVMFGVFVSIFLWPYSIWSHATKGKMRDLFT